MKKALFVVVFLGAMVASADDSYLYWMVGDDAPSYSYARVKDTATGDYLTLWDEWLDSSYGTQVSKSVVDAARNDGEAFYASLNGITKEGSSWVVELYEAGKTDPIDSSQPLPYSSAYVNNGIAGGGSSLPAMGTSFATPEPNSALLMLVGCAMLGLRRRKQKKA